MGFLVLSFLSFPFLFFPFLFFPFLFFPTMTALKSKMNYGAALQKDMFERKDTLAMVEAAVSKDGMLLSKVIHQTPTICCAAVRQNWRALSYVREITNFLVQDAVEQSPQAASLIPAEFHLTAVIHNVDCFDYIRKPTMECCRYVLKYKPDFIAKFKNPPLELCLQVVKDRHRNAMRVITCTMPPLYDEYLGIGYLKGMPITEELVRQALPATKGSIWRSLPPVLQTKYDLDALRLNAFLLKYMEKTAVRLKAVVEGNPLALRNMEQTSELVEVACKANPRVLQIVKNPSRDLVWRCAERWEGAIQYAQKQDLELCVHAVKHHIGALQYVHENPLRVWVLSRSMQMPQLDMLFPQHRRYINSYHGMGHTFFQRIAFQCRDHPTVSAEEMEDPITLAPVDIGTLVAVIEENGKQHFAGTWESLWGMMMAGFRGSNYARIFVPIKNALVPANQIQWRMTA